MPIDAKKYERLKAILASGDELDPEARSAALAAVQEYQDSFLSKGVGADQAPVADGETRLIGQPQPVTGDSLAQDLVRRLDPSQPLQPQVLAIQPSTTHPAGDKAAADEWVRGDLSNPNGTVIVYEAPAETVRQKIAENPQILKALGYDMPLTPEALQSIETGDSIHQAYNDWEWRNTADAAAKAGKTAYRYSRAPWMAGGKNAGILDTLSTKVKSAALPGLETATAFVMGYDDTANFGATRAIDEAGLDPLGEPFASNEPSDIPKRQTAIPGAHPIANKDEAVNSVAVRQDLSPTERNDILREEHPTAHTAGQVLGAVPEAIGAGAKLAAKGASKAVGALGEAGKAAGAAIEGAAEQGVKALSHWNPATQLWEWVTSQPVSKGMPDVVSATVKGAFGAGASQAVTEGVQAGANLAATGDTGKDVGGVVRRIGQASTVGGLTAAPFSVAERGARGYGNMIREGRRYDGLPGRLERLGVEPKIGRGYVDPPKVAAARDAAKARQPLEVEAADVLAEEIAGPIRQLAIEDAAKVKPKGKGYWDTPADEVAQRAGGKDAEKAAKREAAAILRRAGANTPDGTLKKVVSVMKQKKGQSAQTDYMAQMAERAGVADKLRTARTLDPLDRLHDKVTKSDLGKLRNPLSPTKLFDEGQIRFAYPIARKAEKPLGKVAQGQPGRLVAVGRGDDEADERKDKRLEGPVKRYEAATKAERIRPKKKKRPERPKKKRRPSTEETE